MVKGRFWDRCFWMPTTWEGREVTSQNSGMTKSNSMAGTWVGPE